MRFRLSIFLATVLTMGILSVGVAQAQGNINNALGNLGRLGTKTGTTETDLGTIVGTAINAALTLVGIIFLILMVYAGYLWMTARGEEAPIENAKKIVKAALIGLVLVMSAYAITFFVVNRFEGQSNTNANSGLNGPCAWQIQGARPNTPTSGSATNVTRDACRAACVSGAQASGGTVQRCIWNNSDRII